MGIMGTWEEGKPVSARALGRKEAGLEAGEQRAGVTWAWTARWKAPRLKGSMEPLWFLVPSGKTQTLT